MGNNYEKILCTNNPEFYHHNKKYEIWTVLKLSKKDCEFI